MGSGRLTLDLDAPGRSIGWWELPHSGHDDAWGVIRVPVGVISGGRGPTAILTAGNHGDEWEGPILLGELLRDLGPARVQGRLIVLPALNLPAVKAGRRVSPLDGLNLNRCFPGDPLGSPTQQIAAFLAQELMPLADAFVDLHSGGSSLDILPSAVIEPAADPALAARIEAAVRAFGAPVTVEIANRGDPRTSTATAVRAGLVTVGTELGGGGTVQARALDIGRAGLRGVLHHLGILEAAAAVAPAGPELHAISAPGAHLLADEDGVWEGAHPLGAPVRAGEVAGRVHHVARPGRPAAIHRYGADGILYARRQPGRCAAGSCVAVVATPRLSA